MMDQRENCPRWGGGEERERERRGMSAWVKDGCEEKGGLLPLGQPHHGLPLLGQPHHGLLPLGQLHLVLPP